MPSKPSLLFLCFCLSANATFAQTNSVYQTAARLQGLSQSVAQHDTMTLALLAQKPFAAINALMYAQTRWLPANAPVQVAQIDRLEQLRSIAQYIYVVAPNDKVIRSNKLLQKVAALQPFLPDKVAALAASTLPYLALKAAIDSVETLKLDYVPRKYSQSATTESRTELPANNSSFNTNALLSTAAFGIPSQSQIILGAAAFLAERFKTELSVSYLDAMQRNLSQSELRYIFPSTSSLLNFHSIASQQQIGTLLRTSFEQDLHNLSGNFIASLDKPDGFAKYIGKDTVLAGALRYAQGTHAIFEGVARGTSPTDILATTAANYHEVTAHDFDKIVNVLALFDQNFKVQTPQGSKLLDATYLQNSDTLQYFLALVYHQNEPLMQAIGATPEVMRTEYAQYFDKMRNTLATIKRVEQTVQQLQATLTANNNPQAPAAPQTVAQYAQYIAQMNDLVRSGLPYLRSTSQAKAQTYLTLSSKLLEIHQASEERRYGVVLNNLVYTIDWLAPKSEKTAELHAALAKIVRYGSFMLDVSNAHSDREVQTILENYALPVGSYSLKRRSHWNIGVQAYVGGFAGAEYYTARGLSAANALKGNIAFAAPIGIDISQGNTARESSWSCFFSVVDLGAVVSFRLGDPDVQNLPTLNFANILAPGCHFF